MSKQVSQQHWAGIVYGRSYHVDFRFIALPQDFSSSETNWASQYILATTRKARKLSSHPRWSLFKNESHCVIGVTCMVRDLIGMENELVETFARDNRGRPLYVFVGYVTQLGSQQYLLDLPLYSGDYLENFASLYHYVERVWQVKNYHPDSKQPLLTEYQQLAFTSKTLEANSTTDSVEQLNYQGKCPDKVFLWQDSPEQNRKLWAASANCPKPISICLGSDRKTYYDNPFLNQTVDELAEFTIQDRIAAEIERVPTEVPSRGRSLSESITNKVKQDIDFTLHHAAQVASLGQELIDNFADWSHNPKKPAIGLETEPEDEENFGFKAKKSTTSTTESQDWF